MELRIENMTCGGCAKSVTKAIQSVDPNARIETDPASRGVKIETAATRAAGRRTGALYQRAGWRRSPWPFRTEVCDWLSTPAGHTEHRIHSQSAHDQNRDLAVSKDFRSLTA